MPEYGVSVATLINTGEGPVELANELMSDTRSALSEVIRSNQKLRADG
jgi:hypothetical protein